MTIKITASVFLLSCFAGPALAQAEPSSPVMLLHGNYCGPGNNGSLAPVDALDAACARHDACTPDGALASKGCNLRLQQEAARVAQDPRAPEDLKAMAGFVSAGAALMPSATEEQAGTVAMSSEPQPVRVRPSSRRTKQSVSNLQPAVY